MGLQTAKIEPFLAGTADTQWLVFVNGYEKSPGFAAANTIERGLVDILHWLVEMSSKQNPLVGWTLHIEMDWTTKGGVKRKTSTAAAPFYSR
jgi:hypothetical protein